MECYQQSPQDIFTALESIPQGLSSVEAAKRLAQNGYNELQQKGRASLLSLIWAAWRDPMMLILAAVVVIKIALGEWVDAGVIFAVLAINSVISVAQTRKAEGSLEALRNLSAPTAKVKRDDHLVVIPARELTIGDVVILEAGDFVPADGRIIACNSLNVDEGILTGESVSIEKQDGILSSSFLPLGDRTNMVYNGTIAVHGRAEFVVTATSFQAEIGKIAQLIETAQERQTPLQRKLKHFSKRLGLAILALCAVIFTVQVVRIWVDGGELQHGILNAFMFAIAVAVAAIPEALSSVVTIVLASGTKKMAAQHAIIRNLPAVEALGSASVICTDKTGTLTQNKMTVTDSFLLTDQQPLLNAMALCNDATLDADGDLMGEPTETALLNFCEKSGQSVESLRTQYKRLSELPFDSKRKLMSTVHDLNGLAMLTKGAPDVLFTRCTNVLVDGQVVPFDAVMKARFEAANEQFSRDALRVLAYATKAVTTTALTPADEQGYTLIGLTAMIDPPREEVPDSIALAKAAGIKTVMITGDHKTTAYAIAKQIGIAEEGDVAVTGMELDSMSDDDLTDNLEKISVYARVSPENKIRIVKAWQTKGEITAMTGDGVNDAPSLKQADIGVAMGSGTEVAKDASAMILTDDNFVSIINAVAIGRTIFDNIKKTVGYLFSGNLGGIIVILFALIANWDMPLTALQILFINLVNDALPAIALGLEDGEPHVMNRPPRDMNEGIFGNGLIGSVVTRGTLIGSAAIAAQWLGTTLFSAEIGSAMVFTTLIFARTLQIFSSRSNTRSILQVKLFGNRFAFGAMVVCFALYGLTVLPGARGIFGIAPTFGWQNFGIAAGLALSSVAAMECVKWLKRKKTAWI
ncbi:MAG: cation-translocating P-type ATPase [Oscillospiraceae bacterium]|nr:cation-translocating P-type ATPase [Oscillospiraceae bacterium]